MHSKKIMLSKCFLSGKGQSGQYDVTEDSHAKESWPFQ